MTDIGNHHISSVMESGWNAKCRQNQNIMEIMEIMLSRVYILSYTKVRCHGTIVIGQLSWDSCHWTVIIGQLSWDSCHWKVVIGQFSWDNCHWTVVMGQLPWDTCS